MRKVCYISGTRADFGLMRSTLQKIHQAEVLQLSIVVTGMHLLPEYGFTEREIVEAGLPIDARISVETGWSNGALMAKNIGRMLIGFVDAFEAIRPDIVIVLGDRGEMLAGALAALHLDIPVVHIHGGERSGTIDEPVRHAISKLAHFHFVATEQSKERLIRMGEVAKNVCVVGAPGLDGLTELVVADRDALCCRVDFDPARRIALMIYHPVLQEAGTSGIDAGLIIDALRSQDTQILALLPNSDAGSAAIISVLQERASEGHIHLVNHLPRTEFVSWMATADVMVGNSSSGIIEAATFGTPVVNIGSRQNLRQRNDNVIDCPAEGQAIRDALSLASSVSSKLASNVYGDGHAGTRIVDLLIGLDLSSSAVAKSNVY